MFNFLRKLVPDNHPLRLLYHKIMASFAAVFYGFPGDDMIVIGVTGTNGKTTTVNLVASVLKAAGHKVGMTSSINFQVGDQQWANISKQSTQGPFALQKLLRQMVKAGCKYAVIEVTSHAVTQSRILGINFDVAAITNVTEDHIEYHGSFTNYLAAKGGLFRKVSRGKRKSGISKSLILNVDDQHYGYFNQYVADRKVTFGLKAATVYAENIESMSTGSNFVLHVPNNAIPVSIKLPGQFNVYNGLTAAAIGLALQIPLDAIKRGLEDSVSVTGRFEPVDCGQNFSVIVDYAHTPDALESLLQLYRKLTPGRLFAVFGATGGGRDRSKRPLMGKIASESADYIILTNDDPYLENEVQIIDQIADGVAREEGRSFWKIPDRFEAIKFALTMAKEGDTVVVAGKGAEEVIMLRGERIPWNDKKVIKSILEREIEVELYSK